MLSSGPRKSSRHARLAVALAVALAATLPIPLHGQPPEGEPPLTVSWEAQALVIDGGTPMARAAVLGVGRDRVNYTARTLRFDQVVTADETGAARFELPDQEAVPQRSVWVVVDLATGDFTVAAPEGAELRRIETPARGLGAAARFLDQEGRRLDVLLVRPESGPEGVGASGVWGLRVGDGGRMDGDGKVDHNLSLRFADLQPLAESPAAPDRLAPKDVLVGVDPESLEIYAEQLAAPPADGGQS